MNVQRIKNHFKTIFYGALEERKEKRFIAHYKFIKLSFSSV
mgnify:CR=1 FL=1